MSYDAVVVGGGPAGAVCAAQSARSGLKTLVLERAIFPRDKVCGDCLNPACQPILSRLGLEEEAASLAHGHLREAEFIDPAGRSLVLPLPATGPPMLAVKRRTFDAMLLRRAAEWGAEVRQGEPVLRVQHTTGAAEVPTVHGMFQSRFLVAADGRNSTVARLRQLLPPPRRDRVAVQTHLPLPPGLSGRVTMRFHGHGYSGLADIGGGEANLCLVARPAYLPAMQAEAARTFGMDSDTVWNTVTPLERQAISPAEPGLLLIGDSARVVEPFTGEGMYYAMASGELAAYFLARDRLAEYPRAQRRLYQGRLWINRLARQACLHGGLATALLAVGRRWPEGLQRLVSAVVRLPGSPPAGAER